MKNIGGVHAGKVQHNLFAMVRIEVVTSRLYNILLLGTDKCSSVVVKEPRICLFVMDPTKAKILSVTDKYL